MLRETRKAASLSVGLLVCLLAALASGCSVDASEPDTTPQFSAPRGKVTVFAAASLTDAFNEVAAAFEKQNPGTEVEFNFQGSPTLRTQLEQGARAEIFASADPNQMNIALQNGIVSDAGKTFVHNSLVVIAPKDNPGRVNTLLDLRRSGLKLVLTNAEVPVGSYSRQALAAMEKDAAFGAGFSDAVLKKVVSLESNVKQVVTRVELGEADAGIVYGSDVTPSVASKLAVIQIPRQFNVIAEYPIALTKEAANRALALAFIEFVLSTSGQAIMQKHGFQTPSS